MTASSTKRKRVLSGMRPTGKLHLGNYVGALQNWVRMQDQYECFFCVVDWHALTTDYADTSKVKRIRSRSLLDWLAAGLDPERSVIFHPVACSGACGVALAVFDDHAAGLAGARADLQRTARQYQGQRSGDVRIPGISRAAGGGHSDLQGRLVPVGEDQVAHVELTREIARRFNGFYGAPEGSLS